MSYDVRAIANIVLDVASSEGQRVSNLRINKIIYFLHAGFLREFGKPLISAKIEAWDHGPVLREVYHQFKKFGRSEIVGRAHRVNVETGEYEVASAEVSAEEMDYLVERCKQLLRVPAGVLVERSHAEGGPWHIARFGSGQVNPGVQITDHLIIEYFKREPRH
jgi:uncharacterized phage-associated protein